jgi:hypothetical protein
VTSTRLHPDDLAALADLVAVRVIDALSTRPSERTLAQVALMTAAQVAERFRIRRAWVYEHADELGALRLGDGPRARLRFDPAKVAAALSACERNRGSGSTESRGAKQKPTASRTGRTRAGAQLLPIKGAAEVRSGQQDKWGRVALTTGPVAPEKTAPAQSGRYRHADDVRPSPDLTSSGAPTERSSRMAATNRTARDA